MVEQRIGAIVLAAGAASRFGSDKLLALYDGAPLIRFAVRAAALSSADPITLVVAPDKLDAYRPQVRVLGRTIQIVVAERASSDFAYSLRAGLGSMPEGVAGVVVLLADMPLVDAPLVNTLIDAYASTDYAVVPEHNGRWGNPVLLSRAAFADAEKLGGDCGARRLLRARANQVRPVTWDSCCLIDVDTKQALYELQALNLIRSSC